MKNLKVELRKRYFHVLQVILTLGQRQVIVPTLQRLHKNDKIIKYPVWASHSHFRVSGHYEFFDWSTFCKKKSKKKSCEYWNQQHFFSDSLHWLLLSDFFHTQSALTPTGVQQACYLKYHPKRISQQWQLLHSTA